MWVVCAVMSLEERWTTFGGGYAEPRTREPPPGREVREHRPRPARPAVSYEGAFPGRLCCRARRLMPRAGTATPIRTGTPAAIPTQRTSAR